MRSAVIIVVLFVLLTASVGFVLLTASVGLAPWTRQEIGQVDIGSHDVIACAREHGLKLPMVQPSISD